MGESKNLPQHVLRVPTYGELQTFARAFAAGHLSLLMVCGDAGIGKTRCIREALGGSAFWIEGNASPFGIYIQAYQHRNQPIVLDDMDGLYRERNGVRLLKGLCQSERSKSLNWLTHAPALDKLGIPRHFTTTSRVVIIANHWKSLNADVAALEDRGHFLHFSPSPVEIHRHAASWFWDQEIYDFVAKHLHLMSKHSLRTYILAWEQRQAGLDWRQVVLSRCLTGAALEVAKLRADPSFRSEDERIANFITSGFGCRATYFNHAKKLRGDDDAPEIVLTHPAPPEKQSHVIPTPPQPRSRRRANTQKA